jgi:hypothetical protein
MGKFNKKASPLGRVNFFIIEEERRMKRRLALIVGGIAAALTLGMVFSGCVPESGGDSTPALTGTVNIIGTPMVDERLEADTGSLNGSGTISYQWKRDGTINIGANSGSYTVTADDIGSTITVTVTRSGYSGSVASAATTPVTGRAGESSELSGKWYSGAEFYDFRSDGKLYIMGLDTYGVTYTVSGNIITTYVSGSQTGTATFSILGSGATARLMITAPATSDFSRLATGTYTRRA